jgi:hypothetical protein
MVSSLKFPKPLDPKYLASGLKELMVSHFILNIYLHKSSREYFFSQLIH